MCCFYKSVGTCQCYITLCLIYYYVYTNIEINIEILKFQKTRASYYRNFV